MLKFNIIVFIALAVVVASALGYFVVRDLRSEFAKEEKKEIPNVLKEGQGEVTLDEKATKAPDLNRPIIFSIDLPEKTKKDTEARIKEISAKLKENLALYSHWLELGLLRRLIGDYIGAAIVWEYAASLNPTSFVPSQNLGDLYAYNLKDYLKAEAYYKTSLSKDEKTIMVYEKLYELYKYYLKDPARAKTVLEEGISKNPQTSDRLKYLLSGLTTF